MTTFQRKKTYWAWSFDITSWIFGIWWSDKEEYDTFFAIELGPFQLSKNNS